MSPDGSHVYADDGVYTVTVTVRDDAFDFDTPIHWTGVHDDRVRLGVGDHALADAKRARVLAQGRQKRSLEPLLLVLRHHLEEVLEREDRGAEVGDRTLKHVGDAEQHVSGGQSLSCDDGTFLDDANAKAGQVVVPQLIKIGHDGRLATDQCAIGLHTAIADARYDHDGLAVVADGAGEEDRREDGNGACL